MPSEWLQGETHKHQLDQVWLLQPGGLHEAPLRGFARVQAMSSKRQTATLGRGQKQSKQRGDQLRHADEGLLEKHESTGEVMAIVQCTVSSDTHFLFHLILFTQPDRGSQFGLAGACLCARRQLGAPRRVGMERIVIIIDAFTCVYTFCVHCF